MTDLMALAKAGYQGYANATNGKTFDGRTMPAWDNLPDRTTQAWAAAAEAIVTAALELPPTSRETP